MTQSRHGGQILADQLAIEGVERVFSVPGESFLAALDGLYESGIRNIVCRQEGGAAMMAEAHGKLTGRPGVLFVTRGPGATNASSGIHVAMQDSTPMVVFVGQIDTRHRDREAFQEVDYKRAFSPIAKWVAEVDHTERLPEYIARAFQIAQSGRPGPVVLALPENMLSAMATVPSRPRARPATQTATNRDAHDIAKALKSAERPLVVVGGSGWGQAARAHLEQFAAAWNLPVALAFRRQDYMDNRHACYAGDLNVGINPALAQRMRDADCLLVLGSRLGDIATAGYTLLDPAQLSLSLLHVHADPDEPGHIYAPDLAVAASPASMLAQLASLTPPSTPVWAEWRRKARQDFEDWLIPKDTPGPVKMEQIVPWLSDTLPEDAILTNGAGNYAAFLHRYFCYKTFNTQLAPTSGSMGYGFPAAISAKLHHPERDVICLAGDGCFQMTCNEMSTAMQHGAAVIVVVVNNGKYGTIRMHQEKTYPGRVSGTALMNPDFAALARSYGAFGVTVTQTDHFAEAFTQAKAAGTLAVIELQLDDEVMSTGLSLSQTRALGQTQGQAGG